MKPIKTHTFKILRNDGAVVPARFSVVPLDYRAACDNPTKSPDREIVLDYSVCDRDFLYLAIHEPMHALQWHKAEPSIVNDSRELARWLWRLGYRRLT